VFALFVYLCDGRVIEVDKVTSVKLEQTALVLYTGTKPVQRFDLKEVYFSSNVRAAPIPC
jgi:hypothetical protein